MNEIMVHETPGELSVNDIRAQVNKIQALMKEIMHKDEHFGVIPGTKKPSLYKPGAEKLGLAFRLAPDFDVKRNDLDDGHREYEVICTLYHMPTGNKVGQGVGNCSTLESKFRYRNVWENGVKTKVENPDIADVYNTVMKMAKKRAHVDAMITACAASDIFAQDLEDVESDGSRSSRNSANQKTGKNRQKNSENGTNSPKKGQNQQKPNLPEKNREIGNRINADINQAVKDGIMSKEEGLMFKQDLAASVQDIAELEKLGERLNNRIEELGFEEELEELAGSGEE